MRSTDDLSALLGPAPIQLGPSASLDVELSHYFTGPSPWSRSPVVVVRLHLNAAPSQSERLRALIDGDGKGAARARTPVGMVASAIADIAGRWQSEAMQIELASGMVELHPTRAAVWTEAVFATSALQSLRSALQAVARLATGAVTLPELRSTVPKELRDLSVNNIPNNESRVLIAAARRRDIPFLNRSNDKALWQFGWGRKSEIFWATCCTKDGHFGRALASNKYLAKQFFRQLGLPTPAGRLLAADEDLPAVAREIGWPCVAKPATGLAGKGVTANITGLETLAQAVELARQSSLAPKADVLIEAHEAGDDYRLMVVDGLLVMAVRLDPPFVIGDGRQTIAELIADVNVLRASGANGLAYAKAIKVDEAMKIALAGRNLDPTSVPAKGAKVLLRANSNHATGGTCVDVLAAVHPQVKAMAEAAAVATGLRVVGMDYMTVDISRSHDEAGGAFLEINSSPGMEVLITGGVVDPNLGEIVIGNRPGRIPIDLIVAATDNHAALLEELAPSADDMATVSPGRLRIGRTELDCAKLDPRECVEAALRHRGVSRVTILWSSETVRNWGLPVDLLDSAILAETLPPSWLKVLDRHSRSMFTDVHPDDAAALSRDTARSR